MSVKNQLFCLHFVAKMLIYKNNICIINIL
nr:MAG TPA: hypothetical protein [Caudoviricetes sp.]DAY41982.1 MAG TPA: hypothetical protein [Caudoviricetes sp.]